MIDIKLVVGVDPGQHTGIALIDTITRKVKGVSTLSWWDAWDCFMAMKREKSHVLFVIENSRPIKKIWTAKKNMSREAFGEVARSVGMNNGDSIRLLEGLRREGFYAIDAPPKKTKRNAEFIKDRTGFEGRTNGHNRDAIMAAWPYRFKQVADEVVRGLVKTT